MLGVIRMVSDLFGVMTGRKTSLRLGSESRWLEVWWCHYCEVEEDESPAIAARARASAPAPTATTSQTLYQSPAAVAAARRAALLAAERRAAVPAAERERELVPLRSAHAAAKRRVFDQ